MRPPSTTMAGAADLKQHLNFGHSLGPQGPQGIPHGHTHGHLGGHGGHHGVVNSFDRPHGVHVGHSSQHSVTSHNNQQIQVSSGHQLNNGHYSNSNGNGNHQNHHQNPANQTLSSFTQVNSSESVFHYKCVKILNVFSKKKS